MFPVLGSSFCYHCFNSTPENVVIGTTNSYCYRNMSLYHPFTCSITLQYTSGLHLLEMVVEWLRDHVFMHWSKETCLYSFVHWNKIQYWSTEVLWYTLLRWWVTVNQCLGITIFGRIILIQWKFVSLNLQNGQSVLLVLGCYSFDFPHWIWIKFMV